MSKEAKKTENPAPVSRDVAMWAFPVEVSDVDMAFPTNVIGRFLPPMEDIPEEFMRRNNKWCNKASSLFFCGGTIDLKPEINRQAAFRQLKACLSTNTKSRELPTCSVCGATRPHNRWLTNGWQST